MATTTLTDIDIAILDHAQLDAFTDILRDSDAYEDLTILTDDEFTRGTIEFNLIASHDGEVGIATQLHDPLTADDTILDFRRESEPDFSEYLLGLV